MANQLNEWFVSGKGYYISLVTDKQGDVQLGVESKYGDYCSVKMSKEEMITNLRDLANQVEGWLQQETGGWGQPETEQQAQAWKDDD